MTFPLLLRKMLILPVLLITLSIAIIFCDPCNEIDQNQFFSIYLSSRSNVDYFFGTYPENGRVIYAISDVRFCHQNDTETRLNLKDCEFGYTIQFDVPIQRSSCIPTRGVLFRFLDAEEIETITKLIQFRETFHYDFSVNNFYGLTVAMGPGASDMNIGNPRPFLKSGPSVNMVLMFNEKGNQSQEGYEKGQLDKISEIINWGGEAMQQNFINVAFDSFYLSKTDQNVLGAWCSGLKFNISVILYSLAPQPQPDPVELKQRIKKLLTRTRRFHFLVNDDLRTKIFSSVPFIEWQYHPQDRRVDCRTRTEVGRKQLSKFLENPRALRIFSVWDCFGTLSLRSCEADEEVPLGSLLMKLRRNERPIFLTFMTPISISIIDFSSYRIVPFIILQVLVGPNGAASKVDSFDEVYNGKLRARYVLAFVEEEGPEKSYGEQHIRDLVSMLRKPTFLNRDIGIRLSVSFLAAKNLYGIFEPLCLQDNYKYLVLEESCDSKVKINNFTNVKFNLHQLCHRSTYLFAGGALREYLLIDKSIVDPEPPITLPTQAIRSLKIESPTSGRILNQNLPPTTKEYGYKSNGCIKIVSAARMILIVIAVGKICFVVFKIEGN